MLESCALKIRPSKAVAEVERKTQKLSCKPAAACFLLSVVPSSLGRKSCLRSGAGCSGAFRWSARSSSAAHSSPHRQSVAAASLRCVGHRPSAAPAVTKVPAAAANPSSRCFVRQALFAPPCRAGWITLRRVWACGACSCACGDLKRGCPPPPPLWFSFFGVLYSGSDGLTACNQVGLLPVGQINFRNGCSWRRSLPPQTSLRSPFAPHPAFVIMFMLHIMTPAHHQNRRCLDGARVSQSC